MMTLHIKAQGGKKETMELPIPLEKLHQQMEDIRRSGKSVSITHIDSPIPGLEWQLTGSATLPYSVLPKLNRLAEIIDEMTLAERYHLCGALVSSIPMKLEAALQTAAHVKAADPESYETIPGVTKEYDLGRWLVEHDHLDEKVPDFLWPHLHYGSIGSEYIYRHKGVFMPEGYIGVKDDLSRQGVLRLTLSSAKKEVTLGLPLSNERLEQAKRELEIMDFSQASVRAVKFSTLYLCLEDLLPLDTITVEEANSLAVRLWQDITDFNLVQCCAALAAEAPDSFSRALEIVSRTC